MRKKFSTAAVAGYMLLSAILAFAWGYVSNDLKTFPYGLINRAASAFSGAEEQSPHPSDLTMLQLSSLPYIAGSPILDKAARDGVTIHVKGKTQEGYTLYNPEHLNKALLIDMDGEIVHEWSRPGSENWHHTELMDNGDLFAIDEGSSILKLDRGSNLLWQTKGGFHHDISVGGDGTIYALDKVQEDHPEICPDKKLDIDYITVMSAAGKVLSRTSLLDVLVNSGLAYLIPTARRPDTDIFHANTIEVFDGSLAYRSPELFKKGNMLLSYRNLDLIGIYDPGKKALVWHWGPGNIHRQHDPALLPSGNILVFDNGVGLSKVVEIDPMTLKAVWIYGGNNAEAFKSQSRGSAQRLSNGNTLVCVSDNSYAFEVTPDRQVVWKFVIPEKFKDEKGTELRGVSYRMRRVEGPKPGFVR